MVVGKEIELVWATIGTAVVASAVLLPLYNRFRMQSRRGLPLPPGSMGLPFLGESLSLKSQRQNFWIARQHRFGDVYKSHLFGHPSIVIAGPEAARFVLVDRASSFRQRGLPMIEKLLGSNFFGYKNDKDHTSLRKIMHAPLLPDTLECAIPQVEALAIAILQSWEGKIINTLEEAKQYVFKVAMELIVGVAPYHEKEELTRACEHLIRGVSSLPINIPGTNYHKAIKESRKKACALLDKIISFRSLEKTPHEDILGLLMEVEDEDGIKLKPEEIHDNVLTLLFAAYDTSAAALCWTIKNLTDRPKLLEDVVAEHDLIEEKKSHSNDEKLKWSDVKDHMPLTIRVIKETLRLANVVEFSYREAIEDVEYKGYLFPKGWRIIVAHAAFHMNPDNFPRPEEFDSSRFKIQPKLNTFTPFGNGGNPMERRRGLNIYQCTSQREAFPFMSNEGNDELIQLDAKLKHLPIFNLINLNLVQHLFSRFHSVMEYKILRVFSLDLTSVREL